MKILSDRTVFLYPIAMAALAITVIVLNTAKDMTFPILIIMGAVLQFSQIRYVKIGEDGVELHSIVRTICYLEWIEVERIDIDNEHLVEVGGKSSTLKFYTKTYIKFIPYQANDKKSISLEYSRRAIREIKQYTKLPIFDSTTQSE